MTSEKQSPSAIDFLATMQEAVQLEKRLASKTSSSKALKDLLNSSIAQYNKLVTKKEHRIDGRKKIMVYNLPLGQFLGMISLKLVSAPCLL